MPPEARSQAISQHHEASTAWPGGSRADQASWYAATAGERPEFPALHGDAECEVCVVGGGYSGLSAALHLAERGVDVTLLEANRVGWGASGRNGGQALRGHRVGQQQLERRLGTPHARRLWRLGYDAVGEVAGLVQRHGIDCDLRRGSLYIARDPGAARACASEVRFLAAHYDEHQLELIEGDRLARYTQVQGARAAILDPGSLHLHPLRFALGLARACHRAGVRLHEQTRVLSRHPGAPQRLSLERGTLRARQVILACNGYLGGLDQECARYIMPLNSFMVATAPLSSELADSVIAGGLCAADSRFVVNYWRLSEDRRLLFGGGETYSSRFPGSIQDFVRPRMIKLFPALSDTAIDYGWGGTLAITRSRLPFLRALDGNTFCLQGYSGHGVALATLAGRLVAEASCGSRDAFDSFATLPERAFPGGTFLRAPLQIAGMLYYSLKDRLAG